MINSVLGAVHICPGFNLKPENVVAICLSFIKVLNTSCKVNKLLICISNAKKYVNAILPSAIVNAAHKCLADHANRLEFTVLIKTTVFNGWC